MAEAIKYIWRCARCACHFANIVKTEGTVKQEKKCPKCKSLNELTINNKEIFIHCKFFDPETNGFTRTVEESYAFPTSNAPEDEA
jgi:phage FluMu protein Com